MAKPIASPSAVPPASAAGEFSALDSLVREHYGRLCNFAYRLVGSRDEAEDLVQDVFVGIWRRQEQFDPHDPLPYLYRSVRNQALSLHRHRLVREHHRTRVAHAGLREDPGVGAELELTALQHAVAQAVNALPERCRLIFTMSREQDLSYAAIARVLGISVKTVETQMGRALKVLREQLAGYLCVAFSAATTGRWLA